MASNDCRFCKTQPKPPFNPQLCTDCQAWDGLYHVTDCLRDHYPGIDPDTFSHPSSRLGYYKQVFQESLNTLNFHSLDSFLSGKACLICTEIGRAMRDSAKESERMTGWEVATWRPFLFPSQSEAKSGPKAKAMATWRALRNRGIDARVILPICISEKPTSGDEPQYTTHLIELQLSYGNHDGTDLKAVSRWDRTKIDVSIIRRWLADCQKHHGPNCNTLVTPLSLPANFRLIDTHDWCVVMADEPMEYIAFSYVWAAATSSSTKGRFQLDTKSLAVLGKKASLRTDSLSELIMDAIQLCADIGYRYLWVDQLCIVQDDGDMKMEQINGMDAIYHKAVMTIVALGDGKGGERKSVGLPGASSRPRQLRLGYQPWVLSIDGSYAGVHTPGIHSAIKSSAWNERGWTYQERVLSRRHLFIGTDHFYLNCVRLKHDSDEPYEHKSEGRGSQAGIGFSDHGYERGIRGRSYYDPVMTLYHSSVKEYTRRTLSFSSDSLNAFLGVGSILAARQKTKLLFGLPERYLFEALLWHHNGKVGKLRNMPNTAPPIPTWSWAAWEGPADYDGGYWHFHDTVYEMSPNSESHVGNLVKLYYVDPILGKDAGAIRPVEEDRLWFQRRQDVSVEGDDLPSRWANIISGMSKSRWQTRMNGKKALDLWRNCVHSPWEAAKHANIEDLAALTNVPSGSLIFNTTFAHLTVEARPPSQSDNPEPEIASHPAVLNLSLVDTRGNVVGQILPLPRDEALRAFRIGDTYGVAVLGACVTTKTGRYGNDPWGLVVLVVRKEEGISRRVALGAVNPQAWTDLQPQWETVALA